MKERVKVAVSGALGKMGRECLRAIIGDEQLELVGGIDIRGKGVDLGVLAGGTEIGHAIELDLDNLLKRGGVQVLVDFTNPQSVRRNIKTALENRVCTVVGTTGLTESDIQEIGAAAEKSQVGVFIAPNFALGAVLMMRFAQEAARYFPNVEIIELHHDQKLDAPSGTALKTAEMIMQSRAVFRQGAEKEYEKLAGARGADFQGMRVHSVRLPGLVAHQEVLFGGWGQTLSIRHDSINRESFMPGLILAIKQVTRLKGLVVGLEQLLDQ
ncbi:MAG: 4-hydroxy-tetrahydrodipicolinate reductase [Firmicutes bacterium]|nr:4-hydroxy-tetrahydrodipicolinate reductase [Bacillota bacterium]